MLVSAQMGFQFAFSIMPCTDLRPSAHYPYLLNCGAVSRKPGDECVVLVGLDHSGKTTDGLVGLGI